MCRLPDVPSGMESADRASLAPNRGRHRSLSWCVPGALSHTTFEFRVKSTVRAFLSSKWVAPVWSPLLGDRVSIFTLHRFRVPDVNPCGHDPAVLRSILERLRRERYTLLGLRELIDIFEERRPVPERSVVFTVDDGYFDFSAAAVGVFLEYDCPVTVFVPTGFMDGTCWLWWDQVAFMLQHTERPEIHAELERESLSLHLGDMEDRRRLANRLSERLTRVADVTKREFIVRLADAAEVELPAAPPAEYAALGWDQVRRLENVGVTFGPHSVTHPVLTHVTAAEASFEIGESWRVLRERTVRPLPVFCYPNGSAGVREVELVAASAISAALTTAVGYTSTEDFHATSRSRFTLARFPYPDGADSLCVMASGLSRLTHPVRRVMRGVPWVLDAH